MCHPCHGSAHAFAYSPWLFLRINGAQFVIPLDGIARGCGWRGRRAVVEGRGTMYCTFEYSTRYVPYNEVHNVHCCTGVQYCKTNYCTDVQYLVLYNSGIVQLHTGTVVLYYVLFVPGTATWKQDIKYVYSHPPYSATTYLVAMYTHYESILYYYHR